MLLRTTLVSAVLDRWLIQITIENYSSCTVVTDYEVSIAVCYQSATNLSLYVCGGHTERVIDFLGYRYLSRDGNVD